MSALREAAQQALEAMEHLHRTGDTQVFDLCYANTVIPALRAALEQPEQEPVVVMDAPLLLNGQPLYTHPPRREWRGLTEEERDAFVKRCADYYGYGDKPLHLTAGAGFYVMAQAIEAALKEKNA